MNTLGLCDEPRTVEYSSSDGQLFDDVTSLLVLFESGRFGVEPTRKEEDQCLECKQRKNTGDLSALQSLTL